MLTDQLVELLREGAGSFVTHREEPVFHLSGVARPCFVTRRNREREEDRLLALRLAARLLSPGQRTDGASGLDPGHVAAPGALTP